MKNKHVGLLVVGIAIVFFFVVMSFNNALETIVTETCTHGSACPMHITVRTQEIISYSLMGLLVAAGIFISFFMKDEQATVIGPEEGKSELTPEESSHSVLSHRDAPNDNEVGDVPSGTKEKKLENLDEEERQIMNVVLREDGSVYQSDLIKETGFSKVKITRILDKLEGKNLIDRKRRGMTNVVILK